MRFRLPARAFFPPKGRFSGLAKHALVSIIALGAASLALTAAIAAFRVAPTTISFPYLDPDVHAEIPASNEMGISFKATSLDPGETWIVEFGARSDLTSGGNTIPISNVRWTISGTALPSGSLQSGTLRLDVFQPAGSGPGDPFGKKAEVAATVQFFLSNSRSYAPGTYTAMIDVRASVPRSVKIASVMLTITIAPSATLTLGMGSINFPAAHPGLVPSAAAAENPVSVSSSVQMSASTVATLTCTAAGDLVSRDDSIPASAVSWTATGLGFLSGTMSRASAQIAGRWTGIGTRAGTFSFFLANSWDYSVGVYSMSVIYTLTVL